MRLVPSTRGTLEVTARRTRGVVNHEHAAVRFGAIREYINPLIGESDDPDGAIQAITIRFATKRAAT